jgi:MarR family 2-MHQ and catechol resistance regulon transcriptional repressor
LEQDDMKIKLPQSMADRAMGRLMRVGDRMWRDSDARFSRWGLTENHYNVLRILNGAGEPLSQAEMGRRMLSSRANITKLVDLLERQGYVRRMVGEDRRVNLVELTEAGTTFLRDTIAEATGFAEEAMRGLTKAELKALHELLGKLLPE